MNATTATVINNTTDLLKQFSNSWVKSLPSGIQFEEDFLVENHSLIDWEYISQNGESGIAPEVVEALWETDSIPEISKYFQYGDADLVKSEIGKITLEVALQHQDCFSEDDIVGFVKEGMEIPWEALSKNPTINLHNEGKWEATFTDTNTFSDAFVSEFGQEIFWEHVAKSRQLSAAELNLAIPEITFDVYCQYQKFDVDFLPFVNGDRQITKKQMELLCRWQVISKEQLEVGKNIVPWDVIFGNQADIPPHLVETYRTGKTARAIRNNKVLPEGEKEVLLKIAEAK